MTRADGTTLINHLRRMLGTGALAGLRDEELLERFVTRRDEAAFAALLRRHGPMVWSVCRRHLVHCQDVEDAFQATFLLLAGKAAAIERREALANWLFGVARRSALRLRAVQARRAQRERSGGPLPDVAGNPDPSPDDVRGVLDEELARMPAKYRLPLLLCGLEGLTHAEAGRSLGWPTGTVAGRLSRGRALLRTRLLRRGLKVPTAALAAVLTGTVAPPVRVAAAVLNAAALVAAGKSAAAGLSPAVAVLMQGVARMSILSRCLTATALLAALAMTLGGAAAAWHLTRATEVSSADPGGPAPDRLPPAPGVLCESPGRAGKSTPGQPALRLPADPNAVVLRMERSVGSATAPVTRLTVHADGRVAAVVPDGLATLAPSDLTRHVRGRAGAARPEPERTRVIEGRLSARELEGLLRFAVQDQEFFDFDPAAVRTAIRETYQSECDVSDPTDATTTGFFVRTADRDHEVKWRRLARAAWEFPEVGRLLQLYALDRRLQQVFYVLMAGGPERVEAVAAKMNQLVCPYYHRYPEVPQLTAADLFSVTPSRDGSQMQFTFSRNEDRTVRRPLFEVAVDVPPQGDPTLFYVVPPRK